MTLKEELEILRGEPIDVFDGNPMDIPCIETSDPDKLCKHPVVSVQMCAYNHEPYIRQAIEGVMMQKTDFEFELIIGEDASTDKTREICFECQKKYPDKIRVLWWHENVFKVGGNSRRVQAHCRGEFIAFCEGDDYWIDPLKLQKQVDIMRKYPNVGFCFCGAKRFFQKENRYDNWNDENVTYKPGVQNKDWFFTTFMFGMGPKHRTEKHYTGFIMTASTMLRHSLLIKIQEKYEVFKWQLRLGDATLWLACSSETDGYYIEDQMSVYRITDTGVFQNVKTQGGVRIDGIIVRLFFLLTEWKMGLCDCPRDMLLTLNCLITEKLNRMARIASFAWAQLSLPYKAVIVQWQWYMIPFWLCSMLFLWVWPLKRLAVSLAYHAQRRYGWSSALLGKYREVGL